MGALPSSKFGIEGGIYYNQLQKIMPITPFYERTAFRMLWIPVKFRFAYYSDLAVFQKATCSDFLHSG